MRFFFCVGELVHASLVQELVYASVAHAWSPRNGDHIQASHSLPMQFFCVRELVHASLVQELVYVSVAHASILLHASSPKNKGWVLSVHRPLFHRPRVHLITRVEP